MNAELSTRPASVNDRDFLWRVYASTRDDEVSAFGWPTAQKQAFLEMQYRVRSQSYSAAYPEAEHLVLLDNGADAGSMIVARTELEIHLVDIAFLPEYRGRGLGTAALAALIHEAKIRSVPLRLSVHRGNRALRLYERLGFSVISADPMYIEMERDAKCTTT
jgi:ribosomal protein S18 acetylase RimI-like enzyme